MYSNKSPPTRVAWIETGKLPADCKWELSPPTRVAWIETFRSSALPFALLVATHTGGVDRNALHQGRFGNCRASPPTRVAWIETAPCQLIKDVQCAVATHTGGVDRNCLPCFKAAVQRNVATHTGGVDRNSLRANFGWQDKPSPPTRVAWIETFRLVSSLSESLSRHPHGWRG